MRLRHFTIPTVLLTALAIGCAGPGTKAEEDWQTAFTELEEAYDATEDPGEKATLAETYLSTYPETENTADMAEVIVYYRGSQLGDWNRVWTSLSAASEQVEDPKIRLDLAMALRDAANALERSFDLQPYVAALEAVRPLTFSEHADLMEAAGQDEDWAMTERHSRAGLDMANPEAYRLDYPDLEATDRQVAERAARREATARAWLGWALVHSGREAEGFEHFVAADEVAPRSYFDIPDGPLYRLWGNADVEHGRIEEGLDRLARAALWADDAEAMDDVEALYPDLGETEPLEDWLWDTRLRTAKTVDDVTLPDYTGVEHDLVALRGEAMLLTFWFPT